MGLHVTIEVNNIKSYLDNLENARENLIKYGRDVVNTCRAIVVGIVFGQDVENLIDKLNHVFTRLNDHIKNYPELSHSNAFYSIATEYVEALQTYSIIKSKRVLSLDELEVHPIPYLLGLAEAIGELKRISLEFLRRNRVNEAYELLEIAEEIYKALTTFGYSDAILPGFRRKLDVYRKVIDDWKRFLLDMDSRRALIERLKLIEVPRQ